MTYRIAHISDPHFFDSSFSVNDLFSKRVLGHLNSKCTRNKFYHERLLESLPTLFFELNVNTVLVTGDLTSTSHEKEFAKAKDWINSLDKNGIKTLILPGNHDAYTKNSYTNQSFYNLFSHQNQSIGSLKEDKLELHHLFDKWWAILLDTAVPTNLLSSSGFFSKAIAEKLSYLLDHFDQSASIIIANHFPMNSFSLRKRLYGSKNLIKILKNNKVKLYLHGHIHKNNLADLREKNLPIAISSGSISNIEKGSWNLLEFKDSKTLLCNPYIWGNEAWRSLPSVEIKW